MAYGIPYGLFSPLCTKFASSIVKKEYRYFSVTVVWSIAAAIFGGFTPYIANFLVAHYGASAVSLYIYTIIAANIFSLITMKEKRHRNTADAKTCETNNT